MTFPDVVSLQAAIGACCFIFAVGFLVGSILVDRYRYHQGFEAGRGKERGDEINARKDN